MNREQFFGLLTGMSAEDLAQVQIAYWLSKDAHRIQKRDEGERYFEHPRAVALLLIERGYRDAGTLIRALLHDVIEDTYVPTQVILNLFGHDMWRSLFRLSKVIPVFDPITGKVIGRYKKSNDVYFTELRQGPESDQIVKCADGLHNLRTMGVWELPRQIRYATEKRDYLLPMARAVDPWFAQEIEAIIAPVLAPA